MEFFRPSATELRKHSVVLFKTVDKQSRSTKSMLLRSDESAFPLLSSFNALAQQKGYYTLTDIKHIQSTEFYFENLIEQFPVRVHFISPKFYEDREELIERIGRIGKNRKSLKMFREANKNGDFDGFLTYYPPKSANSEKSWQQLRKAMFVHRARPFHHYQQERRKVERLAAKINKFSQKNESVINFRAAGGVDLQVELKGHEEFIYGNSNIPSFEVYFTPDPGSVNGIFTTNRGSYIKGYYIEEIQLKIKDGEVIDFSSSDDKVMEEILAVPGANKIGEVGFVADIGRIDKQTGMLIIDENIRNSMHIALGRGYLRSNKNALESNLHIDIVNTSLSSVVLKKGSRELRVA